MLLSLKTPLAHAHVFRINLLKWEKEFSDSHLPSSQHLNPFH